MFEIIILLTKAAGITIKISVLGMIFGLLGGITLGVLSSNQVKTTIAANFIFIYVTLIRGIPLFVQLFLIYYGIPEMTNLDINPTTAGIVTLAINSSAYLTEIIRASIDSISDGQWNISKSLGYSQTKTLRYIILPQAIKIALPGIINELSALIKESGVLMIIGVPELLKISKDIVARELKPIEIYSATALMYLCLTSILAFIGRNLEKKI